MELTARKKEILKVVIEHYIETAEPVGSKTIAEKMTSKVSSATIRNELADLVEMGYLEQPHTSAGRIPSPKGYRLYVNELMERRSLSQQETEEINCALQPKMQGLDSMISQAGQVVSSIVQYPAYTVAEAPGGGGILRYDLLPVDSHSFIAVVMTEDSRVKSQLVQSEMEVSAEGLAQLSELLNTNFTRKTQPEMSNMLMDMAGQTEPAMFMALSRAVDYAVGILNDNVHVYTTGEKNILKLPEFRDADKAHQLMSVLSDSQQSLPVPAEGTNMQILIGPENVNEALKDTSVVVASYDIGDHMRGLIGVVGPTRMDYASVAARLNYFAESLTKMFGKRSSELPPKKETETHE